MEIDMKKTVKGILFLVAVCVAAAGGYYIVMISNADFATKLFFAGFLLLLALIVGIYSAAVTKDAKLCDIKKALESVGSCGVAIYKDGEFVFANEKYARTEEKLGFNVFNAVTDGKELDGYVIKSEKTVCGKGEFVVISVCEAVSFKEETEEYVVKDEVVKTETEISESENESVDETSAEL